MSHSKLLQTRRRKSRQRRELVVAAKREKKLRKHEAKAAGAETAKSS